MKLIVIGTSAGGLNALSILLEALPADFSPPIAIVQHRSREMSGSLLQLLANKSNLPVQEVHDKTSIQNSRVYLAPADYHLLVEAGYFALSIDPPVRYSRPSIDVMFESAAYIFQNELLGIILTGANRDGAYGAQQIKRRGGRILVQDPVTAYNSIMPKAALNLVQPDWVLPIEEIGPFLIKLAGSE